MQTRSLRIWAVATAVCLAAATAAAKPVEERRPLDADALVSIKNINGSITVEGWDRKELEVTGTITGDVEQVEVSGTASRMRVEARFPENSRHSNGSADLLVKIPVGASLRVSVVNAEIVVSKLNGEVDLEAVNGDVTLSGNPSRVAAQTVNGTIEITAASPQVEAQTVGGRIVLKGVKGDVNAASVGGTIQVSGGRFERGKFTSVSGTIEFDGELAGNADLQAENHSGDIVLRLPGGVSAEFEASTFSGDIQNDFGPSGSKRQYGPGKSLSFTAGGGDARVTINTFSGDVRLLKK